MRENKSTRNARRTPRRARAASAASRPARRPVTNKKRNSTAGRVALQKTAGAVPTSLARAIAEQTRLLDLNQIEPVARLLRIEFAGGAVLDYERTLERAPAIGCSGAGKMVILSPFNGIPQQVELGPELCPDCRTTCDECTNGLRMCTRCGSRREIQAGPEPCECASSGKPSAKCKKCGGAGNVVKWIPCPAMCNEEGQAPCELCQGTGRMATGCAGGDVPPREKLLSTPACPTCRGRRRKLIFSVQDPPVPTLQRYGKKYVALGPIVRLHLQPLDAETPSDSIPFDVIAEPDPMQLVIQPDRPGSQMFMVGGKARRTA